MSAAGKSTLLRILAGKRLVPDANALLLGKDVFRSPPAGVTYLGTEWAMNPVVRGDIVVSHFLDSVGGYRHKERRDRLLEILDVDLDWCVCQGRKQVGDCELTLDFPFWTGTCTRSRTASAGASSSSWA